MPLCTTTREREKTRLPGFGLTKLVFLLICGQTRQVIAEGEDSDGRDRSQCPRMRTVEQLQAQLEMGDDSDDSDESSDADADVEEMSFADRCRARNLHCHAHRPLAG